MGGSTHELPAGLRSLPYLDTVALDTVDLMLVTHFHLDHCAAVPYVTGHTNFKVQSLQSLCCASVLVCSAWLRKFVVQVFLFVLLGLGGDCSHAGTLVALCFAPAIALQGLCQIRFHVPLSVCGGIVIDAGCVTCRARFS